MNLGSPEKRRRLLRLSMICSASRQSSPSHSIDLQCRPVPSAAQRRGGGGGGGAICADPLQYNKNTTQATTFLSMASHAQTGELCTFHHLSTQWAINHPQATPFLCDHRLLPSWVPYICQPPNQLVLASIRLIDHVYAWSSSSTVFLPLLSLNPTTTSHKDPSATLLVFLRSCPVVSCLSCQREF